MPARKSYTQYTVVKGDTLNAIAKRFGSTVAEIASASGVPDPNKIKVGQLLSIPTSAAFDPDALDLMEVPVNVKRVPVSAYDPVVDMANQAAEWLKPPKLWVTLAVAAGVGYYLLGDSKPRRRK